MLTEKCLRKPDPLADITSCGFLFGIITLMFDSKHLSYGKWLAQIPAAGEKCRCRNKSKLYLKVACNDKSPGSLARSNKWQSTIKGSVQHYTLFDCGSMVGCHREGMQIIKVRGRNANIETDDLMRCALTFKAGQAVTSKKVKPDITR